MSRSVRRQAATVDDAVEAARLRESWSRKLLEDEGLRDDHADNLGEAIDTLEERFPGIAGLAIGEANDFARRQGKDRGPDAEVLAQAAVSAGQEAGEREPAGSGAGKRGATQASKRGGGSSRRPSRKGAMRRAAKTRSPAVRRHARRAYRDTGIPGATSSATSTVLSVLGLTVGLSLLYLLLNNAEAAAPGRSAVAQIAGGAARAVQGLILPIDPLRRAGAARKATAPAGPSGPLSGAPAGPSGPLGSAGPVRPTPKGSRRRSNKGLAPRPS